MLCSFITSQPQNDVSHTSLAWRRMWSDNIVTPFKGKTSGIVGVKCPYAVLSIKILALDPAGNSGRWRCMISPRWISTCLDLRLKWTPIGPKGSIKIRLSLQVINTVFNVFSLLFSSFVPPARIKKNPLQNVLQSTIWKGKCGWIFRLSCSFFFFQETYQNRVAFHNATYLAGAVSLYALSQSNKDTAVCLFLSDYL